MTNIMLDYYRLDTNMKAIGFFGSVHVQLDMDDLDNKFMPRYPFAKMLNSTIPFKDKVSTVFINYRYDKENSKYYNKYFFGEYVNCVEKKIINSKNQYLFFNEKRNNINNKINKYSFIMFI